MRVNVRKIISFIMMICIIAVLGLCGCSNKKNGDTTDAGTSVTPTITQAPATVDTTDSSDSSDDAAAPEPEIKVEKSDAKLSVSQASGVYEQGFDLEVSCDKDAQIYYTTDGSNPITSDTKILYEGPIKVADRSNDENYVSAVDPFLFDAANVAVNTTRDGFISTLDSKPSKEDVDKCTVVRAVGIDKKGAYTDVATNTYFIGSMADHVKGIEDSCKAAGTNLAVISLSINYKDLFDPKTGIYVKGDTFDQALKDFLSTGDGKLTNDTSRRLAANYNQKGMDWERNVHVDFFESDGSTTSLGFSQDAGIRIQGNYSRSDLLKGFRLYARSGYGKNEFEYPVFGDGLKDDAGQTITKFKTLTLRNGGNCAFTTKYSDTYWQKLISDMNCDTQTSRPCVVYVNGEYWGLYVLQEDYSQDYFEQAHGVNSKDVIVYKGDAEVYKCGYYLDLGTLPKGVTDTGYYFKDLMDFFNTHTDLKSQADYDEFCKLVDPVSVRDYFAVQTWINNKWDWPGKNWSMWKTANVDESNPYADGRWRLVFYDVEFGGVSGTSDIATNTIKEDNYKPAGMLDRDTVNPIVLCFQYLLSNETFRKDFEATLKGLSDKNFKQDTALTALDVINNTYSPLYDQFFARYKGAGSTDSAINGGYASYKCIKDFLGGRADHIQPMIDYIDNFYKDK